MKIMVLREAGYNEAMLGLSLSHNQSVERMPEVAARLYNKDGGHNKFLESMMVWLDITAPRHFWQQFDTYRVGVTKQSESTEHTLLKREITQDDFDKPIGHVTLERLNLLRTFHDMDGLKNELPEGFLQRRIVCVNYKSLRNIVAQRMFHRQLAWRQFCEFVMVEVEHREFFADLQDQRRLSPPVLSQGGRREE